MSRSSVILMVLLILTGTIAAFPTQTAAQDEYPSGCRDASIISEGTFSGEIDTPGDTDTFRVRVEKGDRLSFSITVPQRQSFFRIFFYGIKLDRPRVSINSTSEGVEWQETAFETTANLNDFTPDTEQTASIFAESDGIICFSLVEDGNSERADIPYNWEFGVSINDPEAPSPPTAELRSKVNELQSQVSGLQSQLESKDQRIGELETELENKNQRISELETEVENKNQRISELETEVENKTQQVSELETEVENKTQQISELETEVENKNQQISELETELENTQKPIEVTVNPADGQNSFQAGGQAVVTASGAAASVLADLTVEYGTETYTVGEDGQLRIPLGESGQQQMAFNYQDSEASVTLNVESQPSSETPTPTGTADATEVSPSTMTDQSGTADSTAQDSDGDGVPDSEDNATRDPDVQDESDIRPQETNTFGPGLGVGAVTVSVVSLLLVALRRRSTS